MGFIEAGHRSWIDLPSSEDSDDEYEDAETYAWKITAVNLVNSNLSVKRQDVKISNRKAMEKAWAAKVEATQDDDVDAFDVAYDGMGEEVPATATDVKVRNLTMRAKGKILLENSCLTIAAGRRYGLVGPNGIGKSTLLRMMAQRKIRVPQGIDVLLVEQEVVGTELSALQTVVAADTELMKLKDEEKDINTKLQALREEDLARDDANTRLAEVYERMMKISACTAEARASSILHGLGFTEQMQQMPTRSLSGGWRMRVSLARALYRQPTLLLLDEPTNHLDLRAVLWLEWYLTRSKKTLIVVSHDRDFLTNVTTDIIHLHERALHFYSGNYAQFEEMYEQRRREANKVADKHEKKIAAAKSSKNACVNTRKVMHGAKTDVAKRKNCKGAIAKETRSMDLPRRWRDYTVNFRFPEPSKLTTPMLQLIDVDFEYPGQNDFTMKNLNIGIDTGSRVAIVGPNGAGKSTLMGLIAGELTPTGGEQRRNRAVKVSKYSQHFVDALRFDDNPVEYLINRFPGFNLTPELVRAKLGKFGLAGAHHLTPIRELSGGQKARVVLARIYYENPHILLMDEPTNHLDMQSIDALGDAFEDFGGGVVVVSHDAQLLSRMCSDHERMQVWVVEDGTVRSYNGSFEQYKNELQKEIAHDMDQGYP